MGNIIRLHKNHENIDEWLSMSNGLTSVFISVLVLSGSSSAKIDREKELIIWLAEHDQDKIGIGTVGFDIDRMPWNKNYFEEEKLFILNVIKGAQDKIGWDKLSYSPDTDRIFYSLEKFYQLINAFTINLVSQETYDERENWRNDPLCGILVGFPICPEHGVLLSWTGCILCNDR